jgi:hypothetical protein
MKQYLTYNGKILWLLAVSRAVPTRIWKTTTILFYIAVRTVESVKLFVNTHNTSRNQNHALLHKNWNISYQYYFTHSVSITITANTAAEENYSGTTLEFSLWIPRAQKNKTYERSIWLHLYSMVLSPVHLISVNVTLKTEYLWLRTTCGYAFSTTKPRVWDQPSTSNVHFSQSVERKYRIINFAIQSLTAAHVNSGGYATDITLSSHKHLS